MSKQRALITGGSGQDAAYLAKLLLSQDFEVFLGVRRSASRQGMWRLKALNIHEHPDLRIVDLDLLDYSNIKGVFDEVQPDHVYNLGAQSFVGVSYKQPISTHLVNGVAVGYILDIIKTFFPHTRLYQASTSEMFGNSEMPENGYNENSPMIPESPYGASKLYAHNLVKIYREAYGLFVCSGILFNHESPLRGGEFVTKKITSYQKKFFSLGTLSRESLKLGNINSVRDWGHAQDYVDAMYRMLNSDSPRDYVVATGETHSVRDFVEKAFYNQIRWEGEGLEEKGYYHDKLAVEISEEFYRPTDVVNLKGDASLIREELSWEPKHDLDSLVTAMLED